MKNTVLFEAAVDSVESALAAERGGARRLELCADLVEGGTTPSAGMIEIVRSRLTVPVMVMIRPRAGDFLYDADELAVMRHDVEVAKDAGAAGIVLGILRADGTVNAEQTRAFVELARPLPVTFHKAFDMTRDLSEALETLIALGVHRVLTSGGAPSVIDGVDEIGELVRQSDGRIIVMAGGGVRVENAAHIVARTAVTELHGRAAGRRNSGMAFRNERVRMGVASPPDEYETLVTDEQRVREIVRSLQVTGPG